MMIARSYNIYTEAIAQAVARELQAEQLDAVWWKFADQTERREEKFKPALIGLFGEQERDCIRRLNASDIGKSITKDAVDDLFQIGHGQWSEKFEVAARPHMINAMREGAEGILSDISSQVGVEIAFDVQNPAVQAALQDKLHKFSFYVNDTTIDELKKQFAIGIEAGEGIPKLRKRVEHVFGIAKKSRTETIARTEVIGITNRGTLDGMKLSGVVKKKEWLATRDARTRESHRGIDGERVLLNEPFSIGGMHPGDWSMRLEEFINCRCTMVVGEFTE